MSYVQGFLIPVPEKNKAAYVAMAERGWPLFKEYGALGMVEGWGHDVPDGEVTSFPMAVKKTADETVVFSWIMWPDKATMDRCMTSMQTDPRWAEMMSGEMPFDGKRMMFGGFEVVVSC